MAKLNEDRMHAHRFRCASVAMTAMLLLGARAGAAEISLPTVPDVAPFDPTALTVPASRRDRTPEPGLLSTSTAPGVASASGSMSDDTTGSIAPPNVPAAEPLPAAPSPDRRETVTVTRTAPSEGAAAPLIEQATEPARPAEPVDVPVEAPKPIVPPVEASGAPPVTGLGPDALAAALATFAMPEPARRPGESLSQARGRQKDHEAIAAFYAARGNAPLWIEQSHLSAAAHAALARIDRAGEDGLNLSSYAVSGLRDPDAAKLAAVELEVSEAVVAYAKQASGARIDPVTIDPLITAKPTIPEIPVILGSVAAASDADAVLHDFNPPQPGYAKLRDKLAELRQQTPMASEAIPSGPTLKPGMRDARVPLIRSRFGLDLPSATADDGLVYDTRVAAAVAEFQRTNGLPVSGVLTPRTIATLSGGNPSRLENELVANMERWRWLPRDLGTDHVMVNVPDYSLDVVEDGAVVHHARVVVGKPDHQTPIFSDAMRFIIVNPYWNVPLSIIKKEMMPKLAENPNYFADHGYEVVERDGTTFVRQPPGEGNALGRIKFMFPNQHSVYLHDTNARALFGKDKRAFSHGCVRVDQPFKLAEVVLGRNNGWSEERIKKMVGGTERTVMLPKPLPIHITYFTSFVDDQGGLQLRDDLYGYSGRVKSVLALKD